MAKASGPAIAGLNTKVAAAKTVTVGLKSPNGLFLRLMKLEDMQESSPAGMRSFKQYVPDLEAGTIELKGYGGAAFGIKQDHRIVGQYALTPNVDGEFIREWLRQNASHDLVKNNLIFIAAEEQDAAAQGREQLQVWDGMNPLKMHATKKDPRVPRKVKTLTKKDDDDDTMVMASPGTSAAA